MTCSETSGAHDPRQTSGASSRIAMSTSVEKIYSHFKASNVNKVAIFTESYKFHLYVVPFYVHFHYVGNSFMYSVIAAQNK